MPLGARPFASAKPVVVVVVVGVGVMRRVARELVGVKAGLAVVAAVLACGGGRGHRGQLLDDTQ